MNNLKNQLYRLISFKYILLVVLSIISSQMNSGMLNAKGISLKTDFNLTENEFLYAVEIDKHKEESIMESKTQQFQERTVSGNVVDNAGIPLPGANILEKSTANGVQTDFDGNFTLTVSDQDAVIVISFVGYTTTEIRIKDQKDLNIILEEDAAALDEVVVIGYGTQQKRHLTGSIGSIDMEEVNRPVGDFGQAMYGQVAGVQIQNTSGSPGASSRIKIRGITSLSGSSAPLIVIDGIPMPSIDLNNINSADIASIDILKDAASAAIYGSRAANGVVLVTTKQGVAGKQNISVNYTYSLQKIMNNVEMMNGPQYARAAIDAAQNGWIDSGGDPNAPNTIEARGQYKYTWPEALENPETLWNTDWEKLYSRIAPMHKVDLSTSGGSENSKYYLSAGFLDQEGMIVTTDYQRYTLNLNAETNLREWLTVGGMLNVSYENRNALEGRALNAIYEYPQIYPEFAENGYLGGPKSIDGFANHYNILMRANDAGHPYWHLYGYDDKRKSSTTLANIYTEIKLLPGLRFRSTANASYERYDRKFVQKVHAGLPKLNQGSVLSTMDRTLNYTLENRLMYDLSINDHNISAVAGYEYNQRDYYYLEGGRTDYDNDETPYLLAGQTINSATDDAYRYALMSIFGRVNYSYNDKYLLSATLRRDGSSRFGPSNKWGNFPSLSGGWILSEEAFMDNYDVLSNFKIRVSYGLTGNDNFSNYAWISRMQKTPLAIGDNASSSYYPSSIENPNLAWERTKQWNFGLDVGIMNNRFTLEADYFRSVSDGLLLNVPIPTTTGFGSIFKNIGELESHGVELGLTSRNLVSKGDGLDWTSRATFSLDRSLITKLGPNDAPLTLSRSSMNLRNAVGEVPFSFYAYKYDGVYINQAEIDADGLEYNFPVHPGDGRYIDVNGDGAITAEDRTLVGNNQSDFIWSLNNEFQFKNIDFSFQLGGQVGGEIYNAHARRSIFNHEGRNYFEVLENRWRSEKEPGDGYYYKLSVDIDGLEKQPSDYWLVSATYFRLRDVTLGYTLPENYAESIGVSNARIYFNGSNLLNWQKSKTIGDPENTTGSNDDAAVSGVQFNSYPTATTFSLGFNVNF